MAILQRSCCGCCDVKGGSIAVAIIWMVLTVIGLGYTGWGISVVTALGGAVRPTDAVTLTIYVVTLIVSILLIIGVVKETRQLLLVWVVVIIISMVVELIMYIYVTVVVMGIISAYAAGTSGDTQAAIVGAGLGGIVAVWVIWGIFFILTVYGCLVVYSHYQNLRDAALGLLPQQGMVVMQQGMAPQQGMVMMGQPVMMVNQQETKTQAY